MDEGGGEWNDGDGHWQCLKGMDEGVFRGEGQWREGMGECVFRGKVRWDVKATMAKGH